MDLQPTDKMDGQPIDNVDGQPTDNVKKDAGEKNENSEFLQEVKDVTDYRTGVDGQGIPPADSVTIDKENDKIKLVIDIKNFKINKENGIVTIEANNSTSGGSRRRRNRKPKNRRARRSRKNYKK